MGNLTIKSNLESNSLYINLGQESILTFRSNGDILLKGKLIENDVEILNGLREIIGTKSFPVNDIRNKMSPIKNLLAILNNKENVKIDFKNDEIKDIFYSEVEVCKNNIDYFCN